MEGGKRDDSLCFPNYQKTVSTESQNVGPPGSRSINTHRGQQIYNRYKQAGRYSHSKQGFIDVVEPSPEQERCNQDRRLNWKAFISDNQQSFQDRMMIDPMNPRKPVEAER